MYIKETQPTPRPGESLDQFVERYWKEWRDTHPPHDHKCMCLGCNGQFDEVPYGIYEDYHSAH